MLLTMSWKRKCGLKWYWPICVSYKHRGSRQKFTFSKYPIPEIPDDSEKKSGMDRVLPKILGSGIGYPSVTGHGGCHCPRVIWKIVIQGGPNRSYCVHTPSRFMGEPRICHRNVRGPDSGRAVQSSGVGQESHLNFQYWHKSLYQKRKRFLYRTLLSKSPAFKAASKVWIVFHDIVTALPLALPGQQFPLKWGHPLLLPPVPLPTAPP